MGLSLRHVSKIYGGGTRAVDDVCLEIGDREFVVLVGPSGCGKTTLLRLIAGLEEPTDGELFCNGVDLGYVETKDRNMSMVFQNFSLYPHLTVFENIGFGLNIRKLPPDEIKKRVGEAAEAVGLTDCLTRKPKTLSGGQRQRVALARAMVRDPDIFLMDEPLSNLDPTLRKQMQYEIKDLFTRLAKTIIYVTHDQDEAMTLADRLVVMDRGRIVQADRPRVVYDFPTDAYTATFIGSPQMNLFGGVPNAGLTAVTVGRTEIAIPPERSVYMTGKPAPQKVLLGIRPDGIKLAESGLPARVLESDDIGDGRALTLLCEQARYEVTALVDKTADVSPGQNVHISLDATRACVFDADTDRALTCVPEYVELPCVLNGLTADVCGTQWDISFLDGRLFDFSARDCTAVRIRTDGITTKNTDGLAICMTVDAVAGYCGESAVYGHADCGAALSFRTRGSDISAGERVTVYVDRRAVSLADGDGCRLSSVEVVKSNAAQCTVTTSGGVSTVRVGKTALRFPALGVSDGRYNIRLVMDKMGYRLPAKKRRRGGGACADGACALTVNAYGEDRLGGKTAVFVAAEGWSDYVTAVLPTEFTVYEYPDFELLLTRDSFELTEI